MDFKLPLKYTTDVKIAITAALYFGSAWLGHFLAFPDSNALPVWPPAGVAFALIVLLGRSAWPGVTIGALVANLMAYWNDLTFSHSTLITVSILMAVGQTMEVLFGNYMMGTWIKSKYPFHKTLDTFRFLFITLSMSLISAWIGGFSLYVNGILTSPLLVEETMRVWVGNVTGILLFTPLMLALVRKGAVHSSSQKVIEFGLFMTTSIGIGLLVELGYFNTTLIQSLPFLFIPILLWLAFRFNLRAAMGVALVASLISIYFTIQKLGPFVQTDGENSMLLLQIFMGVVSICTLVLSATVEERTTAQNELTRFNANLEKMVKDRTMALNVEIDNRKNTEEKLIQTNQELSKRNTELDNFVYSVSHDLRAPIASVLGLINLARKDNDLKMKDVYLDKINQSALQQDAFIKEILDQSRNSRLELKKEEIVFEKLIDDTFNQLKFATATGSAVEKFVTVSQPDTFYGDRWRLKVILNNIISNAIRYRNGHDPIIHVNVDVVDHKAYLEVKDNGRGIPEEHLDKVCNMFYRATDDGAGSGLGLYIVKETIDKLNGEILIESEVGKGTKVKLEIPELV